MYNSVDYISARSGGGEAQGAAAPPPPKQGAAAPAEAAPKFNFYFNIHSVDLIQV